MRRLGVVDVVSEKNFVIVKSFVKGDALLSALNSSVYSSDFKRIGKVVDIIGSVEEPKVVVKLEAEGIKPEPGEVLYYYKEERAPRKRGRRGGAR